MRRPARGGGAVWVATHWRGLKSERRAKKRTLQKANAPKSERGPNGPKGEHFVLLQSSHREKNFTLSVGLRPSTQ